MHFQQFRFRLPCGHNRPTLFQGEEEQEHPKGSDCTTSSEVALDHIPAAEAKDTRVRMVV